MPTALPRGCSRRSTVSIRRRSTNIAGGCGRMKRRREWMLNEDLPPIPTREEVEAARTRRRWITLAEVPGGESRRRAGPRRDHHRVLQRRRDAPRQRDLRYRLSRRRRRPVRRAQAEDARDFAGRNRPSGDTPGATRCALAIAATRRSAPL